VTHAIHAFDVPKLTDVITKGRRRGLRLHSCLPLHLNARKEFFVKLNFNVAQYTIEQVSLSQIIISSLRRVYGDPLLPKLRVEEYH